MADHREAGVRSRKGEARRQSAKPQGGGVAPKRRLQFHLAEQLVERLGVHCSLSHRNESAVVGEILLSWLSRYGRGRELFAPIESTGEDLLEPPSDNGDIGQDGAAA